VQEFREFHQKGKAIQVGVPQVSYAQVDVREMTESFW
jgi:hypothetical protein